MKRNMFGLVGIVATTLVSASSAFAEGAATGASSDLIAIGAGIAIGLAALGGTMGQGKAVSAALESLGRNPSAAGKIFTPMIIGLVLIESLVIYALIIAFQLV